MSNITKINGLQITAQTASYAATASVVLGSITSASYSDTAVSASYALTASYALNGVGGTGPAFPFTGSALITGSLGVTGSFQVSSSAGTIINTTTATLNWNNATSVEWLNRILYDQSSAPAVDWNNRQLKNNSGNTTINWGSYVAADSSGNQAIDWENRGLYDSSITPSVEWGTRILYDNAVGVSVDWATRTLNDSGGSTILDWENAQLNGNASTATSATSASFATNALTASYALSSPGGGGGTTFAAGNINNRLITATGTSPELNGEANLTYDGSVFTVSSNTIITGSLTVGSSSIGSGENTIVVGPPPNGGTGEGGQILLQAVGGTYTSASMLDTYQDKFRILRGTNAGSDAFKMQIDLHSGQVQIPNYNSATAFTGSQTANLGVDSSGNIITTPPPPGIGDVIAITQIMYPFSGF